MTPTDVFSSGDSTIDGMLNELYDCRDSDTHWCEVIDRFMPVLARLVEHVKNYDAMIERSVGAMAIAEGEEGYERIIIDCPMLLAVSELRFKYNAARAEHMDRTRADREIDQFTSVSAGGSGGVPNRQGIDVPVNTAQSQPTADVGAECPKSLYGDGVHTWREDGSVCRDCGQARQNTGPAVDSQFLATPSNEGAGASAAGSVPLEEAMEWLRDARIDHWNMDHVAKCSNAILSHLAAQQAEIERLRDTITDYVNQFRDDSADRARLARELEQARRIIRGAHGSSCICAQCETVAAMPREKS